MSHYLPPTQYRLASLITGRQFEDTGWILEAPGEDKPSLLQSVYSEQQLQVKDNDFGLYKFADWLPVKRLLDGSSAPVTYKSER